MIQNIGDIWSIYDKITLHLRNFAFTMLYNVVRTSIDMCYCTACFYCNCNIHANKINTRDL